MPVTSTPDVSTDIQNNGSVSGADFANRAVDMRVFTITFIINHLNSGAKVHVFYGLPVDLIRTKPALFRTTLSFLCIKVP